MSEFVIYTEKDAPEGARDLLADSKASYGMIPNLHGVMAEAPSLLEAYKRTNDLFVQSSFNADELTVVWQTANVENECHYCVPAHTAVAKSMGVDDAISNALRNKTPLPNARLEALRSFTLTLIRSRGHVDETSIEMFLAAGFTRQNILEVVLGYAMKVMSNYTNHIVDTPVDRGFEPYAWEPADCGAEMTSA